LSPKIAGVEFRERRRERNRCGGHRNQPLAAAGSGRIPSRPNNA
jgi:hypothetical protein